MWFILIGLFCLLAVIGFFATGRPFNFAISGIVFLIALIFAFLIVIIVWVMIDQCSAPFTDHNSTYCQNRNTSTPTSNSTLQNIQNPTNYQNNNTFPVSDNTIQNSTPNQNEKCVTEDGNLKICDLSYSSSVYNQGYRNIFTEGNIVACVNMTTGEVSQGDVGRLRASTATAFCATDFGYVYIDPTLKVSKYYGNITREDYNKPYKVNQPYDTCIWTYNDGSGNIPYLEVLSNVGPRAGYNTKAFCMNGTSQVDIYSSKEN